MNEQNVLELFDRVMRQVRENGQDQRLVNWTITLAERVGMTQEEIERALYVDPRFGTPVVYYP
jgi:hypothetical protein